MEYKITIDQPVVDAYNQYYFAQHPRAKKPPIEKPHQPSLNQILIWSRMQIAGEKAKWKEFGLWLVKCLGLENLKLERFEIETITYFDNKRRHDIDNFCNNKFILDPLVESGFLVDDDSLHLVRAIASIGYDKENPRTEITIKTLD